jgi:hypothetical protein
MRSEALRARYRESARDWRSVLQIEISDLGSSPPRPLTSGPPTGPGSNDRGRMFRASDNLKRQPVCTNCGIYKVLETVHSVSRLRRARKVKHIRIEPFWKHTCCAAFDRSGLIESLLCAWEYKSPGGCDVRATLHMQEVPLWQGGFQCCCLLFYSRQE